MQRLACLAAALLASLVLYVAVFTVVDRPLTLGDIGRQLRFKLDYARSLPSPKLALFAGSNGRYSHRCSTLAEPLGRPCVNLAIGVGIGLDFQLEQFEPVLKLGDVLYMPLEYAQYAVEEAEMEAGLQNTTLVHELRPHLWQLPWQRIARAYGSFDLSFLINGLVESGLAQAGHGRRTSLASLTPQGDEHGHDAREAEAYAGYLQVARFGPVTVPAQSHAQAVLARFLARMRARGVTVFGGLPTVPDDVTVDDATIARIRAVFEDAGQRLLVLPNRSRYPRSCFFDTLSHLREECQLEHSRQVGLALAALLRPALPPVQP